jgi:hypothetical protein
MELVSRLSRFLITSSELTISRFFRSTGRGLTFALAMLVAIGSATVPQPAHAVSPAAAAGIGLGAFALGSVLANP